MTAAQEGPKKKQETALSIQCRSSLPGDNGSRATSPVAEGYSNVADKPGTTYDCRGVWGPRGGKK